MTKDKILVIEDEKKIARIITMELEYEGYEVHAEHAGEQGLEKVLAGNWDLVLLDVMLPEISGLEILRRMRNASVNVPVILLTARDSIPDKVTGLDLGANDYMTKPFQIEELLARIRASLRISKMHMKHEQEKILQVDDLQVFVKSYSVKRANIDIELTPREFELLLYLMENKNIVLSREQILNHVWGYDFMADTNVVDVYIRYLRKKIDYEFEKQLIQTIRGIGYVIKDTTI
ncbi:response regulator transcription factor [Niallia taxi]|uniref:response regulator transcription factor n=1 Tax=Niallia taxi TaxID=2499688 RepID=UPI0013E3C114|nr:response regulator transcription factor [Niallia taxi]MDK8641195.1 response regulator transcription factor [Niallia taxi]MED4039927.1 response regulator transcription factor [Niallia taxi]